MAYANNILAATPAPSGSYIDDDDLNTRWLCPQWSKYLCLFHKRGFRLDTAEDVKKSHRSYLLADLASRSGAPIDGETLCPDPCLKENLFRGTQMHSCKRIIMKAVHRRSREFEIVSLLSQPPLRNDPQNHTIPVFDLIQAPNDVWAFIVMEEWTAFPPVSGICCLWQFTKAMYQCIEHVVFLHKHRISHLDIALSNLVSDTQGNYSYIDYEMSRRFCSSSPPVVHNYHGTEVPPECERGITVDAYKVDVFALGVLILRACKKSGYWVPEFMTIVQPMLEEDPSRRPAAACVLESFEKLTTALRIQPNPRCGHYSG